MEQTLGRTDRQIAALIDFICFREWAHSHVRTRLGKMAALNVPKLRTNYVC